MKKLIFGGSFISYGGIKRMRLARLVPISKISFSNPLPGGRFQMVLNAGIGEKHQIDATTYFIDWMPLTNITMSSDQFLFEDTKAPHFVQRFYRAVLAE